jgi:hypothetical protein
MTKEVSQAAARLGTNPSLTVVWTSNMTNDMAMAMAAGTSALRSPSAYDAGLVR